MRVIHADLFHQKEILYHHPLQFNCGTSASATNELNILVRNSRRAYAVYEHPIKRVNKAFLAWKIRKVYAYDTTS